MYLTNILISDICNIKQTKCVLYQMLNSTNIVQIKQFYLEKNPGFTNTVYFFQHNPASFISFPAVVDKHFLVERPLQSFNRGQLNGESYLLSFTRDEGSEHGNECIALI